MAKTRPDKVEMGGLRLLLLRHAKSAWPEGVADEERPLNGRGRAAAQLMGDYLAEVKLIPDLALVSTARRAQETWALVGERLPAQPETRNIAELYAASSGQMLDVLQAVEPASRTVLILAHNPGMQDLAFELCGGGDAASRERMSEKYPTAGLAVIDFPAAQWRDVGRGMGRLDRFVTPRALG
ncbi:MAG: histidine phosphatase family protein [Rhizobium sp.]|nr:histidine phosphatase family protein [Rhizobium sp.]